MPRPTEKAGGFALFESLFHACQDSCNARRINCIMFVTIYNGDIKHLRSPVSIPTRFIFMNQPIDVNAGRITGWFKQR